MFDSKAWKFAFRAVHRFGGTFQFYQAHPFKIMENMTVVDLMDEMEQAKLFEIQHLTGSELPDNQVYEEASGESLELQASASAK